MCQQVKGDYTPKSRIGYKLSKVVVDLFSQDGRSLAGELSEQDNIYIEGNLVLNDEDFNATKSVCLTKDGASFDFGSLKKTGKYTLTCSVKERFANDPLHFKCSTTIAVDPSETQTFRLTFLYQEKLTVGKPIPTFELALQDEFDNFVEVEQCENVIITFGTSSLKLEGHTIKKSIKAGKIIVDGTGIVVGQFTGATTVKCKVYVREKTFFPSDPVEVNVQPGKRVE